MAGDFLKFVHIYVSPVSLSMTPPCLQFSACDFPAENSRDIAVSTIRRIGHQIPLRGDMLGDTALKVKVVRFMFRQYH